MDTTFTENNAINFHYCPRCGGGNTDTTGFTGPEDYPRHMKCLDCESRARVIEARRRAEEYPWRVIIKPMIKDAEYILRELWIFDAVDRCGHTYYHGARALAMSERVCAKLIADGRI